MRTILRHSQPELGATPLVSARTFATDDSGIVTWDVGSGLRECLSRWRFIVGFIATVTLAALIFNLLLPNVYTATATLLPTKKNDRFSALMSFNPGLASALGNAAIASDQSLYPTLLRARTVIEPLLTIPYPTSSGDLSFTTLTAIVGTTEPERACEEVREFLTTSIERTTGVCRVEVTLPDPQMAAAVCNGWIRSLAQRDVNLRTDNAAQRRQFIDKRLTAVKTELTTAEMLLRTFRSHNLNYSTAIDPDLRMEHERLVRDVTLKTGLYARVSEELELTRIEEERGISRVRILDSAYVPAVKSGPHRVLTTLLAGTAAAPLSVGLLLLWNFITVSLGYDPLARRQPLRILTRWPGLRRLFAGKRSA